MTRTTVAVAAAALLPIGADTLDGLNLVPAVPADLDRALWFGALLLGGWLLHRDLMQRIHAVGAAFRYGYHLAEEHYADCHDGQLGGRHRRAVGESTTAHVPALRSLPSLGTVYTSAAAATAPAQKRRPAPSVRHLSTVKDA